MAKSKYDTVAVRSSNPGLAGLASGEPPTYFWDRTNKKGEPVSKSDDTFASPAEALKDAMEKNPDKPYGTIPVYQ